MHRDYHKFYAVHVYLRSIHISLMPKHESPILLSDLNIKKKLLSDLKLAFKGVFACAGNKIWKSITNTLTVVKV